MDGERIMPKRQTIWQKIWKVLAGFLTIAFPFLVITLLPVGKVVTKLDVLLDRLGPFAMVVFVVLYGIDARILGPAWLFALAAGVRVGLVRGGGRGRLLVSSRGGCSSGGPRISQPRSDSCSRGASRATASRSSPRRTRNTWRWTGRSSATAGRSCWRGGSPRSSPPRSPTTSTG